LSGACLQTLGEFLLVLLWCNVVDLKLGGICTKGFGERGICDYVVRLCTFIFSHVIHLLSSSDVVYLHRIVLFFWTWIKMRQRKEEGELDLLFSCYLCKRRGISDLFLSIFQWNEQTLRIYAFALVMCICWHYYNILSNKKPSLSFAWSNQANFDQDSCGAYNDKLCYMQKELPFHYNIH